MGYTFDMTKFKSKLLNKLDSPQSGKRGPVNLYLDKTLYKEFKEIIEPITISGAIEAFMRDIVETEKKKK